MKTMTRRAGAFLLLFAATSCLAETLAIRTYNVHGIWVPIPVGAGTLMPRSFRYPRIADHLAHDDIVVFEELFTSKGSSDRYRRLLLEADNHITQLTPDVKPVTMFDSGLVLVSARPKEDFGEGLSFSPFSAAHGKWNPFTGNDRLAVKGVARATVRMREGNVHLYFTHLDAGSSRGDREARVAQIDQLDALLKESSAGAAVVLAGDFNTRIEGKDTDADVRRLRSFIQEQGLSDVCAHGACDKTGCGSWKMCDKKRIDHIFYRSGDDLELELVEASWDKVVGPVGPLSDHPALSARFEVAPKKASEGPAD